MADIEKIIDGLNIPKQLLEKSEELLKTLFGPSFNELGGLKTSQVKLRRFNNQIKIFSKAQEKLKQNKINPKQVSLKVLAPLIEYSSLEEEESLQEKWSNLTAHILAGDQEIVFHQNCIAILNKLSTEEANLLDTLHERYLSRRLQRHEKKILQHKVTGERYPTLKNALPPKIDEYKLSQFPFVMKGLSKDLGINMPQLEFIISNLISLGLLKWETGVDVRASKSSENPEDNDIDVSVDVYNNSVFIFTYIGDKFVTICKE